jgi:SNF2 family DNA or RNA helicase
MELWKHQRDMVNWLEERQAGLIAAGMGCGKSRTAIEATRHLDAVFIACPPAVGPAWQKQYRMFEPRRLFVDLIDGPVKKRAERLKDARASGRPFVAVSNYEAMWRSPLAEVIQIIQWGALVADESHKIKAPMGRQSRWLSDLARRHPNAKRIAMTGTPMPQSPLDIFAQARFIDPTIFGTSSVRFRNRYAETDPRFPSKVRKFINTDELTAKVDSFTFRVETDEVLDLPDAVHETVPVLLSPRTMRAYRQLEEDCVTFLEELNGQCFTPHALTQMLRLAQMTGGYLPIETPDGRKSLSLVDGTPAKALALEEWLDGLPAPEPVVIFARFTSDLHEIGAVCRRMGRGSGELSGGGSDLAAWQAGKFPILAVQLQSGGVGIDLTRARYACYYSQDWSLGNYEQSLARIRRPGQERTVFYYHFVAKGTIDEDVYAALAARRTVVEAVVNRLTKRVEVQA